MHAIGESGTPKCDGTVDRLVRLVLDALNSPVQEFIVLRNY